MMQGTIGNSKMLRIAVAAAVLLSADQVEARMFRAASRMMSTTRAAPVKNAVARRGGIYHVQSSPSSAESSSSPVKSSFQVQNPLQLRGASEPRALHAGDLVRNLREARQAGFQNTMRQARIPPKSIDLLGATSSQNARPIEAKKPHQKSKKKVRFEDTAPRTSAPGVPKFVWGVDAEQAFQDKMLRRGKLNKAKLDVLQAENRRRTAALWKNAHRRGRQQRKLVLAQQERDYAFEEYAQWVAEKGPLLKYR